MKAGTKVPASRRTSQYPQRQAASPHDTLTPSTTPELRITALESFFGTDGYLAMCKTEADENLANVEGCVRTVARVLDFQNLLSHNDENRNLCRGLSELLESCADAAALAKTNFEHLLAKRTVRVGCPFPLPPPPAEPEAN